MPKKPSILVVDDDVDIAITVADILMDHGYDVDTANNGYDAIELARARPYDLVILDYKMPDMDGAEVYRRLRQIRSVTVAVMVTAFAGANGVSEALDAGTWRVLRKPMDVGELLHLINVALNQKTVLLVDDDKEFCAALWDTLRDRGFRVGLVHDVPSAQRELDCSAYDVVQLDLHLGEISGEQVLEHLEISQNRARICVVTGLDQDDDVVKGLAQRGVDCVYFKPLAIDEMIDALH